MKVENLTSFEKDQLLRLLMQNAMPETRLLVAKVLPQVYAKLCDVRVVVDTGDNTVVITAKDDKTQFSMTVAHCAGCGEVWPCSVEKNKGAYRPEISVMHSRKDDTEQFRAGSKIRKGRL